MSNYIRRADFFRLGAPFDWETALRRSRAGLAPPLIRLGGRSLAFRADEFAAWAARDYRPEPAEAKS